MKYLYFILVFSVYSCGGSSEPEMVDLNDVLPSSDRYAEGDTLVEEVKVIPYSEKLSSEAMELSDTLGFDVSSLDSIPEKWFPDRFQKRGAEKWIGLINGNEAKVGMYSFSDSLSMKNTLFNWLDCFGKKCDPVYLFEERKVMNEAFVVYSTANTLVYLESKGDINVKRTLENLQRMHSREKPLYVITQNLRQKSTWWKFEEKKWVKIEKEGI